VYSAIDGGLQALDAGFL